MPRTQQGLARWAVVRMPAAIVTIALSGLFATGLPAQAALGNAFIGNNAIAFQSAELTRAGGAEVTTLFGVAYGHRYGKNGDATRISLALRGTARPFDSVNAGVLDAGATVALSHDVRFVPGFSVAAATGVEAMVWGDDVAKTGRLLVTMPLSAGMAYDIRIGRATLSPFAVGSVARYDLRTYIDDVRAAGEKGWDGRYTVGTSLRLKEVVLTSSRIVGEYGMPNRSRWAFSAGISF